jgi:hypothetical protein
MYVADRDIFVLNGVSALSAVYPDKCRLRARRYKSTEKFCTAVRDDGDKNYGTLRSQQNYGTLAAEGRQAGGHSSSSASQDGSARGRGLRGPGTGETDGAGKNMVTIRTLFQWSLHFDQYETAGVQNFVTASFNCVQCSTTFNIFGRVATVMQTAPFHFHRNLVSYQKFISLAIKRLAQPTNKKITNFWNS